MEKSVTKIKTSTYLLISALGALAYCLSGRLALTLAVPPGYATVIWPAAGIALAIFLIYGARFWPCIFIGSLAANLWASPEISSSNFLLPIMIASGIAIGATLQAWGGASLIRRLLPYPDPLCDTNKIFLFSFLSAPISSIINATISNAMLWLFHIVSFDNLLQNWATWWAGDCIGILIFTPLMLIFFEKPREIWKTRVYSVAIPLSILFMVSVAVFVLLKDRDIIKTKSVFKNELINTSILFKRKLHDIENTLESLQDFYDSSETITRKEFKMYTSRKIVKIPGIQALSWNPIVTNSQRKLFIDKAQRDGIKNFNFFQKENGMIVVDKERPFYYVVYYIEPFIGNKSALGFNLASTDSLLKDLDEAAKKNIQIATHNVTLVQGNPHEASVILFAPVYKKNTTKAFNNISGFFSGIVRIKTLMRSILLSNDNTKTKKLLLNNDINIVLRDISDSSKIKSDVLYSDIFEKTNNSRIGKLTREISWESTYSLGNRVWQLTISPTEKYMIVLFSWQSWLMLSFTVLIVGLVNLFLLVVSGQNIKIRDKVEEKTRVLKLLELEKRLILNSVGEAVIGINNEGITTFINHEVTRILEYEQDEIIGKDLHKITHPSHPDGSAYPKDTCMMHTISNNQVTLRDKTDFLIKKNGGIVNIKYTKSPLIKDGKLVGIVISFREVS